MSNPYRANWGIGDTTGLTRHARVVRFPGGEWIRKQEAGEDLGLGSNLRFPLHPIDYAFFPLYVSSNKVYEMTVAQYLNYVGILLSPQHSGLMAQYTRRGKFKLPVGTVAVTQNKLVMCENDVGGVGGDIIPQSDLEAVIFQADDAISAQTDINIGEDLEVIASATLYDQSAGTTTTLTVVSVAPNAGEIWLKSASVIQCGDALEENDIVTIYGTEQEHISRHTVGVSDGAGDVRVDADNYDLVDVELLG